MSLVTPFIGENPNKVIKWTTDQLTKAKDNNGRSYTLKAAGALIIDSAIGIFSVPAFLPVAFVRSSVNSCCSKKVWAEKLIKKTEITSFTNIAKLAARVLTAAFAAIATLVLFVFRPSAAPKLFEKLQLLPKDANNPTNPEVPPAPIVPTQEAIAALQNDAEKAIEDQAVPKNDANSNPEVPAAPVEPVQDAVVELRDDAEVETQDQVKSQDNIENKTIESDVTNQ